MDKWRMWFIAILFLSGLGITLYPFFSNLVAQSNATRAIDTYTESVSQMEQEDIDAAKEAAKKYNEQLSSAYVSSQEQEEGVSYVDLVDVGESLGFITIPKIDVNLPIYSGTSAEALQKGVGHVVESSYPLGGESTHSVLTGHRGLPSAVLFTDLDKLEIGDIFYLHILDEVLAYKVDQIKVVLPEETDDLKIVEGKDYCTLLTCTPYGINSHRLLVRGHRVDNDKTDETRVTADAMRFDMFVDEHKIPFKNEAEIFGHQYIMDENDEIAGEEEYLLINATDLTIEDAFLEVTARGGVCYPAHIDRTSNGMVAVLGTFPETPLFNSVEFHFSENVLQRYQALQ